jgi:hypothetical protein
MTLSEIANQACEDIGYPSNVELVAFAKRKVANRYQIIWNDQLWKDSLYQFTQTMTPTGTTDAQLLAAAGQVMLPSLLERIVAIRTSDNPLSPANQQTFFRCNPDIFAQTGRPIEYFEMSPVAVAFAKSSPRYLWADTLATDDNGSKVTFTGIDSGGVTRSFEYTTLAGGARVVQIVDYYGDGSTDYPVPWVELTSISKPETTGGITLSFSSSSSSNTGSSNDLVLLPGDLTAARRQRIQLVRNPTTEQVLRVLCKKRATVLNDNDSPELTGADAVLLPLVTGDLHWLMKEGDLANAKWSEGGALLEQMKRASVYQTANQPRFTPTVEPDWKDIHRSSVPSKGYYIG